MFWNFAKIVVKKGKNWYTYIIEKVYQFFKKEEMDMSEENQEKIEEKEIQKEQDVQEVEQENVE